jgi:hypothetical protein
MDHVASPPLSAGGALLFPPAPRRNGGAEDFMRANAAIPMRMEHVAKQ